MSEVFFEAAPAKINLALHVTGRRPDGYHSLESLMVFADVSDELEAVAAETDSLQVIGPFATALGSGGTNLVMKAITAFRARWPAHVPFGLALTLRKNLPVAAGLGGGSADAAAALRLMDGLSESSVPADELLSLALGLGADVPACLVPRPCEVRGIGEIVVPLASFPLCHVVLVNPLIPVATADIFRRMQSRDNPPMPALPDPLTLPVQLGIWLAETRNDLEPAATSLVAEIGELIDRMQLTQGCILARMSGSGATVFGLFGSSAQAHQAAHDLRAFRPDYWVAAAPLILPE
jgi:4-diphosphocytidyl-2-C-methyl-D-erythritol kinase